MPDEGSSPGFPCGWQIFSLCAGGSKTCCLELDGTILEGEVGDLALNALSIESAKFRRAMKCCEIVGDTVTVRKRNSTLGELDVVFTPEDCTGDRADRIEVSDV